MFPGADPNSNFDARANAYKQNQSNVAMGNWTPNSTYTQNAPNLSGQLIAGMGQNLKNQQGFANSLQPYQQQLTTHLLNMFGTQGGQAGLAQTNANQVGAQGQSTLQATLARLRGQGASPGALQGATIDQANQNNSADNGFSAHLNSEAGQSQIAQFLQQLTQGANPDLRNLSSLNSIQNPAQSNAPDPLMSGLFSVLGSAAGAGKLFGI